MKANPEIIMVDKLNGKDFKLGEYELDDETGALYVGTHGTVFPGGSATTGGGGTNPDVPIKDGGLVEGYKGFMMGIKLIPYTKINLNMCNGVDFQSKIDTRLYVIPKVFHNQTLYLGDLNAKFTFTFEDV